MKANRRDTRVARRLFQLCQADGRLDDNRVRAAVEHVIASRHRHGLSILSRFERLVRLERGRHAALVESAAPLAGDVQAQVEAALRERYGQDVEASFRTEPALIGGMRITVGSEVLDGSIRNQLAALEALL